MRVTARPWLVTICLSVVCVLDFSRTAEAQRAPSECPDCDVAVARAERLLPKPPNRVVVLDLIRQPPALQQRMKDAEGFVTTGERTVYLKMQGATLQHAVEEQGIWDYALAITIWHEMAHIAGANEVGAQRQEEALWQQFVFEGKVDRTKGLNYLALLRQRRDPPHR